MLAESLFSLKEGGFFLYENDKIRIFIHGDGRQAMTDLVDV
ncbi:hypothetical protein SAMN05444955_11756 [Lihuaxuella thermophila]|uniref:Uncharacterized protein n=1 Tax=Lihuaxuella thermophila TaxID=1173111 RepID=A0A1H8IGC6_9BACL|nr:hypothetical protein SAMN05444955_11756 [Lihuaxuella thermophila]